MTHSAGGARLIRGMLALCCLIGAGCAGQLPAADGETAECPVCREDGDLACLHVKVKDTTPRAEYEGRRYYFCSDECRERFLKEPGKYAAK